MITRIVRLNLKTESISDFVTLFENTKGAIRSSPGCTHLELLRDHNTPQIFYTLSKWNSPQDLENYRSSELFSKTWKTTKTFFAERAEAWSMENISNT